MLKYNLNNQPGPPRDAISRQSVQLFHCAAVTQETLLTTRAILLCCVLLLVAGVEPSQYSLWAPSVLTTLTNLANVQDSWQLQQVQSVNFDQLQPSRGFATTAAATSNSNPTGRRLKAVQVLPNTTSNPLTAVAGVSSGSLNSAGASGESHATRRALQQLHQQAPGGALPSGQSSSQRGATAAVAAAAAAPRLPATASLATAAARTTSTARVVYGMNTTSYTLVAWRLSQPVVGGSSKYGCLNQLCEELAGSGVPVVPGSIGVEPDGLGKHG
jgi:hypothetical protein